MSDADPAVAGGGVLEGRRRLEGLCQYQVIWRMTCVSHYGVPRLQYLSAKLRRACGREAARVWSNCYRTSWEVPQRIRFVDQLLKVRQEMLQNNWR